MNNLSWLLYLGDIIENLKAVLDIFLVLGFISTVCSVGVGFYLKGETYDEESVLKGKYIHKKVLFVCLPLLIVFGLVTSMLPSKQTIYLIAASEMGEEAIKSTTGKKALDALNRYLDSIGREEKTDEER